MRSIIVFTIAVFSLVSCGGKPKKKEIVEKQEVAADTIIPISEALLKKEERHGIYRFEHFDLVFYGFKGYDYNFSKKGCYFSLSDKSDIYPTPSFKVFKANSSDVFKDFAQVKGDTLRIAENNRHDEQLFGDETIAKDIDVMTDVLENIPIQIVPKNAGDKFKVSVACSYHFYEVAKIAGDSAVWNDVENPLRIDGFTNFEQIEDSLGCFYRLFPGETAGEMLWNDYDPPFIKSLLNKHKLRSVEFEIIGEWEEPVRLIFAKGDRLLQFSVGGVLIEIERYHGGEIQETKYVSIELDGRSGC